MSVAYYTGMAAAVDAFYQVVRGTMVTNGWTQFDVINDSVGNRDIIFQSASLAAGSDNYCYLRLTLSGSTWSHRVYTDWDSTTNTGAKEAGQATQTTLNLLSSQYWLRVNEFSIAAVIKVGSSWYKMYAGFLRRGMAQSKSGVTKTTSAYSAGVSSMNVATDMTNRLKIGQKVVIYNHGHSSASANFSNAEVVIIQSVAVGSIAFVAPTFYAYDLGAVIGWNPHPAVVSYWNTGEDLYSNGCYTTMFHDGVWLGVTGQSLQAVPVILAVETFVDPDEVSLEYQCGLVPTNFTAANKTGFHGYMYHWEAAAWSAQAREDVMTDGNNKFIVFMTATSYCHMLGPTI